MSIFTHWETREANIKGRQMLTRDKILQEMQGEHPNIVIEPFFIECLGSDSYDLHLDDTLLVYKDTIPAGMKPAIPYDKAYFDELRKNPNVDGMRDWFIPANQGRDYYEDYCLHPEKYDTRNLKCLLNPFEEKETVEIKIPEQGLILSPFVGYLGSTLEYTETHNIFPFIDGKSTIGRNFTLVHYTAGRGDRGFCGTWTLEINTRYPTVVKPGMRIGQIYYTESNGGMTTEYGSALGSHYKGQIKPTAAKPLKHDQCILDYLKKREATQTK